MAKVVVLYNKAADAAAFHAYYTATHVPIARKIPGLVRYEVSSGAVADPTGASPYELVATLEFESLGSLQQGMGSAEGQAAAGDLANFAQSGVQILMYDTKDV